MTMTPRHHRGPTTKSRQHRPSSTILHAKLASVAASAIGIIIIIVVVLVPNLPSCHARRGALVRDGMNSKSAWDNPLLGRQAGDITMDPDVVAITTRCSKWTVDPITTPTTITDTPTIGGTATTSSDAKRMIRKIVNDALSKDVRTLPLHVTFRSKTLAGGKRPNWMRASASLGGKDPSSSIFFNLSKSVPLRAVWTCSNADADTSSLSYEEMHNPTILKTTTKKKEGGGVGMNVLNDSYEDCLKRLYGKYVELEVLLPKTKKATNNRGGGPPPSIVYRVPIQTGHVNPMGMVSKSRATVTLYPYGRTLATSSPSSNAAVTASSSREGGRKGDLAIPLGLTNIHLPLGPGLVDPSWAKGRKLFWKGRSVGLI